MSETAIEVAADMLVRAMEQQGYRLSLYGLEPDGSVLVAMHEEEVSLDVLKFFSDWLLALKTLDGRFTIHTVLVQQGSIGFRVIEIALPPEGP